MHPPHDSGGFGHPPDTVAGAMNRLPALTKLVFSRLRRVFATGDQRDVEILALRHQLIVLQRQIERTQFTETARTILAMLSSVLDRRRLAEVFLIVRPDTVIGWRRRLVARHWTQPPAAKRGRPPIEPEIRVLVIRLAEENPDSGYWRIHGEVHRLGHQVADSAGCSSSTSTTTITTAPPRHQPTCTQRHDRRRADPPRPADPTTRHVRQAHQRVPRSSLNNHTGRPDLARDQVQRATASITRRRLGPIRRESGRRRVLGTDRTQAAHPAGARTEDRQEPDASRHRRRRHRSRGRPSRCSRRSPRDGRPAPRARHQLDPHGRPEGNEFCVCDGGTGH